MQNPSDYTPIKDGEWFKRWLEARRWSDVAIAKRLGVTTVTIGSWKRGGELRPAILLALTQIDAQDLGERIRTAGH